MTGDTRGGHGFMQLKLAENFRAVFYAPLYAAHALGFYGREGVDIELIGSSGPGDVIPGLIKGTIDITWGGPMRVIKARDQDAGSPLVCFCEIVARDPFYLIGRSEGQSFHLADLGRLRFASVCEVPTPWLCLQHDLRQQGIDPDRIDRAANRSMVENFEALRSKELDVAQVFEPFASMAVKEGVGEILYAASARGRTVYTTFIATREGVAKHRDAFLAMTRAIRRMQDWLPEHSAEELAATTASFFPAVPRDILAGSLRNYLDAGIWARDPAVSEEGFARLAASLYSGAFVSRLPNYRECVEQNLVMTVKSSSEFGVKPSASGTAT
jgi:NitT/TauT family transport system substrate-binding protein